MGKVYCGIWKARREEIARAILLGRYVVLGGGDPFGDIIGVWRFPEISEKLWDARS